MYSSGGAGSPIADDLSKLMPRDLIFVAAFLGESRDRLRAHFHEFIKETLASQAETNAHPFIDSFIETHALILRDFVFSGVSLSHQFRLEEMEQLMGDRAALLRVDIWDQLRSHIEMAERQFRAQAPSLVADIAKLPSPPEPSRRTL